MRDLGTFAGLATSVLALAWAAPALANEDAAAAAAAGDQILVTATRGAPKPITAIPNTVRVLERDTIDTQLALSSSIVDSLSFYVPSFAPGRQKMSGAGETMRGRAPLYLVDGVPQSTPLREGARSGFTIDPEFIDRVEVIFGANAIQGMGATGGVINYVTPSAPKDGEWDTRVTAALTTDDFKDDSLGKKLAVRTAKRFGNFDFLIGAAYETRGLYYDGEGRPVGVNNTQGDSMDSDSWNLFAKLGYDFTENQRLQLLVNAFNMQSDGDYVEVPGVLGVRPTSAVRGNPEGDPAENKARNVALTYTHNDLFGGSLTVQGFYYDFEAIYGGGSRGGVFDDPRIGPIGQVFDQSANNSEKLGLKLTYQKDDVIIPGLQIVGGADYIRDKTYQELIHTGRLWVPETVFKSWSPFMQLEQKLLDERLRVSGGLRYEIAELEVEDFTTLAYYGSRFVTGGSPDFKKLLKNVGVVVEPVDGVNIFASFAEGFTMPDVGRILRGINTPGVNVGSHVDLKPIIADNLEVGVNYTDDRINASISYFWSSSKYGQRLEAISLNNWVVAREKTKIEGLEASLTVKLNGGVTAGTSLAILSGRYDSDQKDGVDSDLGGSNISPNRINFFVEAPVTERLTTRVQAAHLFDRQFTGLKTSPSFNGYTLVDALISYDAGSAGVFTLAAQNLFDKSYISYYSQTLTNFDPTNYFAGRGRSITLRWQGKF